MIKLHELPPVTRAKAMALSPSPIELHKFLNHAGFAIEPNNPLVDARELENTTCARESSDESKPKPKRFGR